jgi:MFS superfamily sulfate permease-like transporter
MFGRALRELTAPNIRLFTAYRSENLRPDLVAGLSVAAVQIPTAIAYAQLAGFPPIVGLYASILPSVVYALFGSSRQLMMGPDAATCAMVAATLVPLAGANPTRYLQLSMALAVLVGGVCILAGLGALALSQTFSHARFSTASSMARVSRLSLANSGRSSDSRWKRRIFCRA